MRPAGGGYRGGGGGRGGSSGRYSGYRGGRGVGSERYSGSRGRSPRPVYRPVVRDSPDVAHPDNAPPGSGSSEVGRRNSDTSSVDCVTEKFSGVLPPDRPYPDNASPGSGSSEVGRRDSDTSSVDYVTEKFSDVLSPERPYPDNASPGSGSSEVGRRNSDTSSVDYAVDKFNGVLSPDRPSGPNPVTHGVKNTSPNNESPKILGNTSEAETQTPEPLVPSGVGRGYGNDFPSLPTHFNACTAQMSRSWGQDEENQSASYLSSKPTHKNKELSQNVDSGFVDNQTQAPQEFQPRKCTSEGTDGKVESEKSDFQENDCSFDICEERNRSVPRLRQPLLEKNRAMRSDMKRRAHGENIKILRSGMILLKGYISLKDQVKLIKACRDLGRGHGGFYQPGYRDGAKLHLKMMCLGKNWDPETSKYVDRRPIDDAKPPLIPDEFRQMVEGALKDCHNYLESQSKVRNVQDILPSMSPDLCIVNFYTKTGKLGLHQDKDESQESIRKGLPVVSFSLGDFAEFLYGDQRDIDKAEKVVLESGDVLIFGGESRLIFHGVSAIKPETAPKPLLEETDLRPGRLNLTFREY